MFIVFEFKVTELFKQNKLYYFKLLFQSHSVTLQVFIKSKYNYKIITYLDIIIIWNFYNNI